MSKRAGVNDDLIFRIRLSTREIELRSGLQEIDLTSRASLYFIGECAADQRQLNVSDIVDGPRSGTAPTVYARLAVLEKAGWIQTRQNPEDGRAKLAELSPHAERTFRKMSSKAAKLLRPAWD
jgi:hypothetical protein